MLEWTYLSKRAIALIITIAAILLFLFILTISNSAIDKGSKQVEDKFTAAEMEALQAYNQSRIPGTGVITAIKTYMNRDLAIIVKTGDWTVNYCAQLPGFTPNQRSSDGSGFLTTKALDPDSQNREIRTAESVGYLTYVNPAARFDCCFIYNSTGVILGIYMEEKKPGIATAVP